MKPDQQLDVFRLLRNMSGHLENVRDDERVLRFCLRATRDFFRAEDGCFARLRHGDALAEIVYEVPKASQWDRALLAAFLRAERPRVPYDHLVVPLWRRARWWGALCLRRRAGEFERGDGRLLQFVADHVSTILERTDQARIHDARARLDRKVSEQLQPRDLFYQILHLLRMLTRYDHSSALLMTTDGGTSMQLVAEQIAWTKARSRRIGTKLAVPEALRDGLTMHAARGFSRTDGRWQAWDDGDGRLAALIDGAALPGAREASPSEATILSAPLVTRDEVIGIIKVAASRPEVLGEYELDLLDQFTPHASVAIQYLQRIESLQDRMLEAERKHVVANIARGVSHDVNNALGSVLPLVQQLRVDAETGAVNPQVWADDLREIESAVQVCRRIFGNMLGFARTSDKLGQANLRRAIETTVAILRSSLDRAGVRVEIDVADELPVIRGGQGDLEQLFLNLITNARDAMADGGLLRVTAKAIPPGVEVLVQDTGRGIPSEILDQIYEPFFTTKVTGSGLGLTICRSLIWTMQGELTLESVPGTGTTARLQLGSIDRTSDVRLGV
jgi:signal transduction histidine kinase